MLVSTSEDSLVSTFEDSDEELFGEGVRSLAEAVDDEEEEVVVEKKPTKPRRPRPPLTNTREVSKTPPPRRELSKFARWVDGRSVVAYEKWLESDQEYADDLKFVNDDIIEVLGLRIEQDRSLGKGGMVWDGSYLLGELVVGQSGRRILELGAGATAIAGLAAARALNAEVYLTDGDGALLDLARRNVLANNLNCHVRRLLWHRDEPSQDHDFWMPPKDAEDEDIPGEFDLILGAECVAPIYDPEALLDTIRRFATPRTTILLVVKHSRWPDNAVHFYDRMREKFDVDVSVPTDSRLRAASNYRVVRARLKT